MVRASSCREERMISIEGGYISIGMKDEVFVIYSGSLGGKISREIL